MSLVENTDVVLSSELTQKAELAGIDLQPVINYAKQQISAAFWEWYKRMRDVTLIKQRILFWTIRLKYKDLHALFVTIFGPEPA